MAEIRPQDELDIPQLLDVVLRRRWLIFSGWALVMLGALFYVFLTKPVYEAQSLLVIEKERGTSAVIADGTMIESSNDDYYQTQYKLLKSESLLQQVYDGLRLQDSGPDFAQPRGLEKLSSAVSVAPVLRSRLVYLRVRSHDPALAARVVNTLADAFIEQNLSNQLFISKEVLQALQMRDGAAGAEESYASLPAVVNNQLIQQLKADYARLHAQYADMGAKFTSKHPSMMALRSNMAALEHQIRSETRRIVQSLKTELSGQLKGNNVRVVDPAGVPKAPVKPRKLASLILGAVAGLLIGSLLAFLVELLDQSVRTQDDIESRLRRPFLGLIPFAAWQGDRAYGSLLSPELSLTSEAFRNLRTMVDFAGVTDGSKAVLVTSTVQDEGKSYVASNLAVAFAQLGEKVLLINGDLRRPSLHRVFGLSTEKGISQFLASGTSVEHLDSLVRETDVPFLKVLPCGPRPPNPSELLNTPRLPALVAWARERFDRVIVDCPPLFPVHDTLLWGRAIPSSIFVVRYGQTRIPLISKACQRLDGAGVKILGLAVNAAKRGGLAYSSYGYYYQQYYHTYETEPAAKDS